jgi:ABC-type polysaccharide/polyol phosphate transport system ATPase subunit
MSIVIQLENVHKKYKRGRLGFKDITKKFSSLLNRDFRHSEKKAGKEFYAIKNVNLIVNKGESVGITGRNGAGKSTLLKLIYGVTKPSSGVIKIKGSIAGYLDVLSCFYHEFTGKENILLAGAYFGAKKEHLKENVEKIIAFAELKESADTPIKKFSSGMFLRLAFSILIHLDHEILFFDEIFAVGDAAFQLKCQKTIKNIIASKSKTVLLVSHNSEFIQSVCSREIVLHNGEIISDKQL